MALSLLCPQGKVSKWPTGKRTDKYRTKNPTAQASKSWSIGRNASCDKLKVHWHKSHQAKFEDGSTECPNSIAIGWLVSRSTAFSAGLLCHNPMSPARAALRPHCRRGIVQAKQAEIADHRPYGENFRITGNEMSHGGLVGVYTGSVVSEYISDSLPNSSRKRA